MTPADFKVFDSFLDVDTWYSKHPADEARFFESLSKVVTDADFNPDQMGEYITQKFKLDDNHDAHPKNEARDHYVSAAWAVRGYLETTGQIED